MNLPPAPCQWLGPASADKQPAILWSAAAEGILSWEWEGWRGVVAGKGKTVEGVSLLIAAAVVSAAEESGRTPSFVAF